MRPDMSQDTVVALRNRLRLARTALTDAQRQQGALLIRQQLDTWLDIRRHVDDRQNPTTRSMAARPVMAAFWPLRDEPDLRPLLTQWVQQGLTIALPIVVAPGQPLMFRTWTADAPMQAGRYGILEPTRGTPVIPELILVPTLGYTDQADRIGYGGGYYDRTLAALKNAGHLFTAIGIAWTSGRVDSSYVPAPHDIRLHAILTPDGWVPMPP